MDYNKRKVLVLTGDTDIARELEDGLSRFYDISSAYNIISAASQMLSGQHPDIALVSPSTEMGESEGVLFCHALRADDRFASIPIIGLKEFPADAKDCLTMELHEDFTVKDVHDTIEGLLLFLKGEEK